ncbi:phospho-sugar mutase [Lutimonas zeaxanthinifaciens]|uniref:phospho-sugar mutase n=1 Tax=Lutimonas zeaxanthinifaciens TaxID=3060215 RepID=UPI00265CC2CC|nr:phospho-sugar mutase [Lutimonas sp. YSD2104]WKK65180.1 phospho-sugar mutase [Lutimonas sp. YSD2104]
MNSIEIINKAKLWIKPPFDQATQKEIQDLLHTDSKDLTDRFYKNLEFGTGGMRGTMGAGTNRINKYTLGKNTQGLSNYLLSTFPGKQPKVAIAYDCRHNSKTFAKSVADVFSANNILVYLFEDLRATPELSYAVRELKCDAGIVLTASHNPPEYNGYKVYFNDGGQIIPPQDGEIVDEINKVEFEDINFEAKEELIKVIGEEIDAKFAQEAVENATSKDTKDRNKLKIVFTSLHGTSITMVPRALELAGFTDVHIVEEQREPDGNFPTVDSPNPEEPAALKMATDLADQIGADIVIGTDPDCDRLGIAVRDLDNKLVLLNGNQTFAVLVDALLKKWQEEGRINGKQFVGSTIVSTPMIQKLASSYGVNTKIGLTGFKWIAKMIREAEGKEEFIGGGEESFGFMVGDFVRDKDAVSSTLLACEIATQAKSMGSSVYAELLQLYKKHGFYKEHLISVVKKGVEGAKEIQQMMSDMRNSPVTEIHGEKVKFLFDYQTSVCKNLLTGEESNIDLPKSNVLIYQTVEGTRMAARPSGTEPKIKFYFSVHKPLESIGDAKQVEEQLDQKIQEIIKEFKL